MQSVSILRITLHKLTRKKVIKITRHYNSCVDYINQFCVLCLCDYTSPILERVLAVLTRHLQEAQTFVY